MCMVWPWGVESSLAPLRGGEQRACSETARNLNTLWKPPLQREAVWTAHVSAVDGFPLPSVRRSVVTVIICQQNK